MNFKESQLQGKCHQQTAPMSLSLRNRMMRQITAHKRSCGKVILSQACVILFTGVGCIPSHNAMGHKGFHPSHNAMGQDGASPAPLSEVCTPHQKYAPPPEVCIPLPEVCTHPLEVCARSRWSTGGRYVSVLECILVF